MVIKPEGFCSLDLHRKFDDRMSNPLGERVHKFLQQFDSIRKELDILKSKTKVLNDPDSRKSASNLSRLQIKNEVDSLLVLARGIITNLEEIYRMHAEDRQDENGTWRSRDLYQLTIDFRMFVNHLLEFEVEFMEECKENVKRWYHTVFGKPANEEEIGMIMRSGIVDGEELMKSCVKSGGDVLVIPVAEEIEIEDAIDANLKLEMRTKMNELVKDQVDYMNANGLLFS
ncbi:syntaxin-related protein KNOLLE-like [Rutidosis leptorrhynchoides]|uniref:syntaxin-related protein KNOLLE-like n=1 Tax=Rutidosis leptorrhynchoides TaxID=125765 RepID=UPI003A99EC0D